ncbi:unnamed protein product [Phytomonas sp. Hart1]|nr:unnamed protein product [Phytomonas sp. Hart1]|eukprot:CCW71127.1 unnamed protein product [Phytomonas sp. isolate Hart1]
MAGCLLGLLVESARGPNSAEAIERVLRKGFLSPVLQEIPLQACCAVTDGIPLGDGTTVWVATAAFNPHVVIHGSSVEGGFTGSEEVYEDFKRQREDVAEEHTVMQLRTAYDYPLVDPSSPEKEEPVAAIGASLNGSFNSLALTGEELTAAFERKVLEVLTTGPRTRADLAAHPSLSEWKSHPSFDGLLKLCLKKHTVYQGRKYTLKE